MDILKEVLKHEVFPSLGCTEPIAVAYTASIAAKEVGGSIEKMKITVDPGVYKNGFAITVPNTNGERGNLIAGVLGAFIKQPESKMEILKHVKKDMIGQAKALIHGNKATLSYDMSKKELFIEVFIKTDKGTARAVIEYGHTNLVYLEKNETPIFQQKSEKDRPAGPGYKSLLKKMSICQLIELALHIDDEDYGYIKRGVDMNLKIAEVGQKLKKVGYYVSDLVEKGYLLKDIFSSSKIMTASAADARMAGLSFPVMSSGGSGNQGIVAILVPYTVGRHYKIEEKRILQSIAISHLLNSYIKCYTSDLSPLCGCAIAAGVGAAVAIVYQQHGNNKEKIALAINNLVSDLGGMLCDGAKAGCALKVASSTDSAIRAAYMALNNHGITKTDGFVGETAEETIYNLSKISKIGMAKVDDTMLRIMVEKN